MKSLAPSQLILVGTWGCCWTCTEPSFSRVSRAGSLSLSCQDNCFSPNQLEGPSLSSCQFMSVCFTLKGKSFTLHTRYESWKYWVEGINSGTKPFVCSCSLSRGCIFLFLFFNLRKQFCIYCEFQCFNNKPCVLYIDILIKYVQMALLNSWNTSCDFSIETY